MVSRLVLNLKEPLRRRPVVNVKDNLQDVNRHPTQRRSLVNGDAGLWSAVQELNGLARTTRGWRLGCALST
jgi:hypothetical protein